MATTVEQKQIRLTKLQDKLEKLDDAIASGVLYIEDEGKRLTYRSMHDMLQARNHLLSLIAGLEAELGETSTVSRIRALHMRPAPAR